MWTHSGMSSQEFLLCGRSSKAERKYAQERSSPSADVTGLGMIGVPAPYCTWRTNDGEVQDGGLFVLGHGAFDR